MNQIVIGKRIPIGAAVGGLVAVAAWAWNSTTPDSALPAHIVQGITTAVVCAVQLAVVNVAGVTTGIK